MSLYYTGLYSLNNNNIETIFVALKLNVFFKESKTVVLFRIAPQGLEVRKNNQYFFYFKLRGRGGGGFSGQKLK